MKQLQILLIEDNPGDADLIRETLEMSKIAVHVDVAGDGPAALKYLKHAPEGALPELILLDLNLPKLDGRRVLAEIKNDPRCCAIPVVIMTSSASELDITECYRLGANCYVTKPLGFLDFQAIVSSIEHFWFTIVSLPETV